MSNILQMNMYAGILILCILVLRKFAADRFPKRLFVFLWGVALLRLLIPYSFSIPWPPAQLIPSSAVGKSTAPYLQNQIVLQVQAMQENHQFDIIPVLWLAGMVFMAGFFIVLLLKNHRSLKDALPIDSNPVIEEWKDRNSVKRVRFLTSDRIGTPIACGVFRPKIILPKTIDLSDSQQLEYVLNHEFVHIKRFDTVWKLCSVAVLCIHWFNPLVWLLYWALNRDIELACDEKVISILGESEKSPYLLTLLSLAEQKAKCLPLYNSFGKHAIEERIDFMMKSKKVTRIGIALSVVIMAASMLIFTSSAVANDTGSVDDLAKPASDEQISETTGDFDNFLIYGANPITTDEDGTLDICINDSDMIIEVTGKNVAEGHKLKIKYHGEETERIFECEKSECDIIQHSSEICEYINNNYLKDTEYEINVVFEEPTAK